MSGFPLPLLSTCTTQPSTCASCLPRLANLPFLVLIGSPIWLPLVPLFPSNFKIRSLRHSDWKKRGVDNLTSLLLIPITWHYWSAEMLVILPKSESVICIQLHPTLRFVWFLQTECGCAGDFRSKDAVGRNIPTEFTIARRHCFCKFWSCAQK